MRPGGVNLSVKQCGFDGRTPAGKLNRGNVRMENIAAEIFRNRQGNCAQAVAMAWHGKNKQLADLSHELAGCGHGKAPEGLCGALYALHRIAGPEQAGVLTGCFAKESGGHTTCEGIRLSKALRCIECVEVAASLLQVIPSAPEPEKENPHGTG